MKEIKFRVLDATGDTLTKHRVDTEEGIAEAEARFKEITGLGFAAAKVTGGGKHEITKNFDKSAKETVFMPGLQGG